MIFGQELALLTFDLGLNFPRVLGHMEVLVGESGCEGSGR
jgi:hypothetical protein